MCQLIFALRTALAAVQLMIEFTKKGEFDMRLFEEPIIEVQNFEIEDVITVSGGGSASTPTTGENELPIAIRPR